MFLTVFDKRLIRQLNHIRTCGNLSTRMRWRIGERRDVTSTSGCASVGINVPTSESDIVYLVASNSWSSSRGHHGNIRASHHHPWTVQQLYLGQRPTDGGHLADKARRPTSFQPPLVRCTGDYNGAADHRAPTSTGATGRRWHGNGRGDGSRNGKRPPHGAVREPVPNGRTSTSSSSQGNTQTLMFASVFVQLVVFHGVDRR